MSIRFSPCGAERADTVHDLTQRAYAPYTNLTPPSGALREVVDDLRAELAQHGGVIGERAGDVVIACARFTRDGSDFLWVRRVAVDPALHRTGVGRALMEWIHEHARTFGYQEVRLGVRTALTTNRAFYDALGYHFVRDHTFAVGSSWVELAYPLP